MTPNKSLHPVSTAPPFAECRRGTGTAMVRVHTQLNERDMCSTCGVCVCTCNKSKETQRSAHSVIAEGGRLLQNHVRC